MQHSQKSRSRKKMRCFHSLLPVSSDIYLHCAENCSVNLGVICCDCGARAQGGNCSVSASLKQFFFLLTELKLLRVLRVTCSDADVMARVIM